MDSKQVIEKINKIDKPQQDKQTYKFIHTDNRMEVTRGEEGRESMKRLRRVKYMVTQGD